MFLWSYPGPLPTNPYFELFYDALAEVGDIRYGGTVEINDAWLRANQSAIDVLHVNWPELYWRQGTSTVQRMRRAIGFWRYLLLARRLGIVVVVTVHNLVPHEDATLLDKGGTWAALSGSDLTICHSAEARRVVARWPGVSSGSTICMPIGNYDGVYPPPQPDPRWLRAAGVRADLPVVACVGVLRDYKGLDIAIEAITHLKDVQLLIAGEPHKRFDVAALRRHCGERVTLIERSLTPSELSDAFALSDVVWFPYRRVTGSAALLTAWTLGRTVVTSDLEYFQEMLRQHPQAGIIFRAGDAVDLASKTKTLLMVPSETRQRHALSAAQAYRWSNLVPEVSERLRLLVRHRRTLKAAVPH
jgi:glycosyltransferase involved in cell wall biosynthesis